MKEQEILKYRQMIEAGLDYLIESIQQKSVIPSNEQHKDVAAVMLDEFKRLKIEARSVQGLSKLKNWFKSISEWPIEEGDVNYELYIKRQTGHDPNVFGSLQRRVEKIRLSGIVKTESQYRDVQLLLNLLFGDNAEDSRIAELDTLLWTYKPRR